MHETGIATVVDHRAETPGRRKPYSPPTLTVFGQVAALTQGTGSSCQNDGNCGVLGTMAAMTSDRRLKTAIQRIGEHPLGIGLYLFRYKDEFAHRLGRARHFGVMADEVEAVMPAAVRRDEHGFQVVNYGMLGIRPVH